MAVIFRPGLTTAQKIDIATQNVDAVNSIVDIAAKSMNAGEVASETTKLSYGISTMSFVLRCYGDSAFSVTVTALR